MDSYNDLKTAMEAIQQQIVETMKNDPAYALKEVNHLYKEFGFTARILEG
jgi:hypothetical protein